jgi:hypothetical protein
VAVRLQVDAEALEAQEEPEAARLQEAARRVLPERGQPKRVLPGRAAPPRVEGALAAALVAAAQRRAADRRRAAAHARALVPEAVAAVAAAARKAALKVGAGKGRKGGKGLAVTVAEAVGRGAARLTNVLGSLTGGSPKRRKS